jgi:sirohydrochlorin cobaltochelatase
MEPIANDPLAGMAGRLVLVVDASLSPAEQQACADAATTLAGRTALPVTVVTVPITRLDDLRDALARAADASRREHQPPPKPDAGPMSSASFLWRDDGRPDWGSMWTSFCELALYGGPPQRGPDTPLRAPAPTEESDPEMLAEMKRGIWETTGLYAESTAPGWLTVTCDSPAMAAWMCAAVLLENVHARVEEDRLIVPAGPKYDLKDEVKSVITVVAKTHHYWQAHVASLRERR